MLTYKDLKRMSALFVVLFVIIGHLFVGYVFPLAACVIIAASYITVYIMNTKWLTVSWVILVIGSYAVIDVITYNPDGISATLYKYMLSMMLAQLYSILLCIACTLSKRKAFKSTVMCNDRKIAKIKATLSVFSLYVIPAVITVVLSSIKNTISDNNMNGTMFLTTSMVVLVILAGLHFITYTDTVLLTRAIEKSEKKEDDNNEVLGETDNGESIRQDDERGTDN